MKKLILCTGVIICFCTGMVAQTTTAASASPSVTVAGSENKSPVKDYDYYIAKSSNQQTAAWLLVGGGALCTAIGLLSFPKDYAIVWGENSNKTESKAEFSTIISVIGGAAMISSIPFFISSSVNKHRAHINLNSKKTGMGIPGGQRDVTGLTLSLALGK